MDTNGQPLQNHTPGSSVSESELSSKTSLPYGFRPAAELGPSPLPPDFGQGAQVDIVGAGGIGICLAVAFHQSGWEVRLVESDSAKLDRGNRLGVGIDGHQTISIPLIPFETWVPADSRPIFLCTKGYRNQEVVRKIPAKVPVFPVQNGFDPDLRTRCTTLEGIASWISECPKDQTVTRITRRGALHFGPATGDPAWLSAAKMLVKVTERAFANLGIRAHWVANTGPFKATKLIYNAAIGPIASGAGIDNGALLTEPKARKLFFALLRENIAIMRHRRVILGRIGPFYPATVAWILGQSWIRASLARWFAPTLKGTYCSMAADFATGLTELDHYNGHLIRLASEKPSPVSCPMNKAVVALVGRWQKKRQKPDRRFLEELEALAGPEVFGDE